MKKAIRFQPMVFITIIMVCISTFVANAQSRYPETAAVLQALYLDEMKAHFTYLAFARKALSEDYPNIAHLFVSLAISESIHALNFKQLLTEMKVEVKEMVKPEIEVSSTKKNLKYATQVELKEIDKRYPQFIERIKPEQYEPAIRMITYAWEAEKQHRDLIEKIRSGTGFLFGILARTIEKGPKQYFVCQICGSTLTEFPKDACPICQNPVLHYKEVEKNK